MAGWSGSCIHALYHSATQPAETESLGMAHKCSLYLEKSLGHFYVYENLRTQGYGNLSLFFEAQGHLNICSSRLFIFNISKY